MTVKISELPVATATARSDVLAGVDISGTQTQKFPLSVLFEDRYGAYSALDYGAVGDGVTDDQAALQLAIDQIESDGGGTLIIPRGTFVIGSVVEDPPASNFFYGIKITSSNVHVHLNPGAVVKLDDNVISGTMFYAIVWFYAESALKSCSVHGPGKIDGNGATNISSAGVVNTGMIKFEGRWSNVRVDGVEFEEVGGAGADGECVRFVGEDADNRVTGAWVGNCFADDFGEFCEWDFADAVIASNNILLNSRQDCIEPAGFAKGFIVSGNIAVGGAGSLIDVFAGTVANSQSEAGVLANNVGYGLTSGNPIIIGTDNTRTGAQHIAAIGNVVYDTSSGVLVRPGAVNDDISLVGNVVNSVADFSGMKVGDGANQVSLIGNRVSDVGDDVEDAYVFGTGSTDILFLGNYGGGAYRDGLFMNAIDNCLIAGNMMRNNNLGDNAGNFGNGFSFHGTNVMAFANASFDDQATETQKYGFLFNSADVDNYAAIGNYAYGNAQDFRLVGTSTRGANNIGSWSIQGGISGIYGVATLASGTVTVETNCVRTGSEVRLIRQAIGANPGHISLGTIVDNTSFVIDSTDASDDGTVFWEIADFVR